MHIAQSYNTVFLSRRSFLDWMDVISSISMLWRGGSDGLWRLEIHSTLMRTTAWEKRIEFTSYKSWNPIRHEFNVTVYHKSLFIPEDSSHKLETLWFSDKGEAF